MDILGHFGHGYFLGESKDIPSGAHFQGHIGEHLLGHHEKPHMTRGFLLPFTLLLLAEKPLHGYALRGRLIEMGVIDKKMPPPIVYNALRHLEREKLAAYQIEDPEGRGPARKVYRITNEGRTVLSYFAQRMGGVMEVLLEFYRRYESLDSGDLPQKKGEE